ncbi:MAG TPA: hypothetical protein VIP46_16505, partial [Pyrinomonadaceae bacterium]
MHPKVRKARALSPTRFTSRSFPLRTTTAQLLSFLLLMQAVAPPALATPRVPAAVGRTFEKVLALGSMLSRAKVSAPSPAAATAQQGNAVVPAGENFGVVLTAVTTPFDDHAGIDHHQSSRKLVVSAHGPTGQPNNFELIEADGAHRDFTNVAGLAGGLKLATARDDGRGQSLGGFRAGEMFTSTGAAGRVARISADGASVQNPWVALAGEGASAIGGLYVDRTGVFGGDLIAVTGGGEIWRISSSGAAALVADLQTPLAGVTTVPDDAERYGPWAGRVLVGAEAQGAIYAIDAQGNVASHPLDLKVEDIRVIPAHENFYGVDPAGRKIWGAPDDAFTSIIGDILVAQGSPGVLASVRWNGSDFELSRIAQVGGWEQIAFSPAGVSEILPVKQVYDRIAVVRHAPELDSGRVEGALWQLLPESLALDGTDAITSDLLVPGTPSVALGDGKPNFSGVIEGVESAQPDGYSITISNNASLRHVITRTNPITLTPVAAPPAPAGERDLALTKAGEGIGDPATLRHLSTSGKAGAVSIPPGTYGRFSAGGHTALVLGVAGSAAPSVYNLEALSLSGGSELRLAGPVRLNVLGDVSLAGSTVGAADDPRRLVLSVAQGSVGVTGSGVLYAVVRTPQGTVSIGGNGRVRGTVTCDRLNVFGNGVLQITESDVAPPPVNRPPAADAGPDQSITLPTDAVSLNGTATDDGLPTGSMVSSVWTKVSGPGPVTFADASAPVTTATFVEPGTYTLRLTASDSLLTDADEMTVEVVPRNQPPVVNAGPDQTVELPAIAALKGTVEDDALPRGSTVAAKWSLVSGPGSVTFGNANSAATSATFSAPGTYTLHLSASDTEFTVFDELIVTVYPENRPPTADAGPDQTVRLPAGVTLNGVTADDGWPHGSPLTSEWSKVSGPGEVSFADAHSPVTTATFYAPGTYTLRLSADDSRATAADECVVEVLPANVEPTVDAGPDQAAALGTNLLRNAGAEGPLVDNRMPGWAGEHWRPSPAGDGTLPVPAEGAVFFYAGDSASAELVQDVDASAFAASVAGGAQQFEFSARARSAQEAIPDSARVIVEYRDAANASVLASFDTGPLAAAGAW